MLGKKEFIENLAVKKGVTNAEATKDVEMFLETLSDACVNGGVSFKGLFTFKKVLKKGRSGSVNGVESTTEDSNTVKVTVGSALKEMLNK